MLGSSLPMALISIMLIICIIGNVGGKFELADRGGGFTNCYFFTALQCHFGVQDNNREVPCNPTFYTSCEKAICELGGETVSEFYIIFISMSIAHP
jgi:hypothetical protein